MPITMEIVSLAKQRLILRRDTHLSRLTDRLKEDRVKRIVQAIINGDNLPLDVEDEDITYVRELCLIGHKESLTFVNPIYMAGETDVCTVI